MGKGDGKKYLKEMQIKSRILLNEAFLLNPKEPPEPPIGFSSQEILNEAIILENKNG